MTFRSPRSRSCLVVALHVCLAGAGRDDSGAGPSAAGSPANGIRTAEALAPRRRQHQRTRFLGGRDTEGSATGDDDGSATEDGEDEEDDPDAYLGWYERFSLGVHSAVERDWTLKRATKPK